MSSIWLSTARRPFQWSAERHPDGSRMALRDLIRIVRADKAEGKTFSGRCGGAWTWKIRWWYSQGRCICQRCHTAKIQSKIRFRRLAEGKNMLWHRCTNGNLHRKDRIAFHGVGDRWVIISAVYKQTNSWHGNCCRHFIANDVKNAWYSPLLLKASCGNFELTRAQALRGVNHACHVASHRSAVYVLFKSFQPLKRRFWLVRQCGLAYFQSILAPDLSWWLSRVKHRASWKRIHPARRYNSVKENIRILQRGFNILKGPRTDVSSILSSVSSMKFANG